MKAKVLSGVLIVLAVIVIVLLVAVEKGYVCTIPDVYPEAVLVVTPIDVLLGESMQFDGRDSFVTRNYSVTGHITKYEWDFNGDWLWDYVEVEDISEDGDGDGIFGSTTHTYPDTGTYLAQLRVTSSVDGEDDVDQCYVFVHEGPAGLYVDPAGDGSDGLSWETAYTTLQGALAAAQFGVTIRVAGSEAGITYYPDEGGGQIPDDQDATFQLVYGVTVEGGYAGLSEPGNEDERDIQKYKTILSGDIDENDAGGVLAGDNSYHVVTGADSAVLDGFTITAGNGSSGGGIYCWLVSPTISNCVITGNVTSREGGGVYIYDYSGTTDFVNCFFVDNKGGQGGGIYMRDSNVSVTNCVFSGNEVTARNGGAIYNDGDMVITNCTFYGNKAKRVGGGVYNDDDMTIVNSIFWGNTSDVSETLESEQIDGDVPVVTYSCIEGLDPGGAFNSGENVENVGADPLFGDAANPAGFDNIYGTWDDGLQLNVGSQCMDSGLNSAAEGIGEDILGNVRIFDGDGNEEEPGVSATVDRGAYEFNYSTGWPYYETGDCYECEGEGLLFAADCTPKYVKVTFEGLSPYQYVPPVGDPPCEECEDWEDDEYVPQYLILKQNDSDDWQVTITKYEHDTGRIGYWYCNWGACSGSNSQLHLIWEYNDGFWDYHFRYFYSVWPESCCIMFDNKTWTDDCDICTFPNVGTASISWGQGIGEAEFIAQFPEWELGHGYKKYEEIKHLDGSDWKIYDCKSDHDSDTSNEPFSGSDWQTYWTLDETPS